MKVTHICNSQIKILIWVFIFPALVLLIFNVWNITKSYPIIGNKNNAVKINKLAKNESPKSKMDRKHRHRKHLPKIYFAKTHKTGSSTIQNILYRLSLKHNLTVAIPYHNNKLPNNFNWPFKFSLASLRNAPGTVDILANHAVYSDDIVKVFQDNNNISKQATNSNLFSFTILREPVSLFKSTFNYFKNEVSCFKEAQTIENFISNPRKFYTDTDNDHDNGIPSFGMFNLKPEPKDRSCWQLARNHMTFDLGFSEEDRFFSDEEIQRNIEIIDDRFNLVLIMEQFLESMVLLGDALNLEMEDLIYITQNVRHEEQISEKSSTEFLKDIINTKDSNTDYEDYFSDKDNELVEDDFLALMVKEWNHADTILYEHFLNIFEQRKKHYGLEKLKHKISELETMIEATYNKCVALTTKKKKYLADNKEFIPWTPQGVEIKMHVIRKNLTKGSEDYEFCANLLRPETSFVYKLRKRQDMHRIPREKYPSHFVGQLLKNILS